MTPALQTARLVLEPYAPTDVEDFVRLSDEDVLRRNDDRAQLRRRSGVRMEPARMPVDPLGMRLLLQATSDPDPHLPHIPIAHRPVPAEVRRARRRTGSLQGHYLGLFSLRPFRRSRVRCIVAWCSETHSGEKDPIRYMREIGSTGAPSGDRFVVPVSLSDLLGGCPVCSMLVSDQARVDSDRVRTAEVVAALSLATDLGMGFPFEHGLGATSLAMRLAGLLEVDSDTATGVFYSSLLMYSGCTTDGEISSRIFVGGLTDNLLPVEFGSTGERLSAVLRAVTPPAASPGRRLVERARRMPAAGRFQKPHYAAVCEVAEMLAERIGLPASVSGLFSQLTERWDGRGVLERSAGEEIPLPLRIVHVARDAAYQRLIRDRDEVVEVIQARSGRAFDPVVVRQFAVASGEFVTASDQSAWEAVLDAEPKPWLELSGDAIDRALGALGTFSDLASPYLSGHSAGVSELASRVAQTCGLSPVEVTEVRRAALVHDLGRAGVDPGIWGKREPLSADDREQIRLHTYHTERVLDRAPFLARLGEVASCHHERCNGSGYHRRLAASSLSPAARLIAAADAFHAMTEPRPHRPHRSPEEAAAVLAAEAERGLHDTEMVAAVLEVSGLPPPRIRRPAGLTEREAEVIGLVARGLQTKQVARHLNISAKTADHHIQNSYRKIGVSTRAAATLFAMEHGLVD